LRLSSEKLVSKFAFQTQRVPLQRGVCQLCHLDTHNLLQALLAEPSVPERMRLLEAVGTFGERRVCAIAARPRAGDLWQADHIVPVSEGGGGAVRPLHSVYP
jgi:hypothetical protein